MGAFVLRRLAIAVPVLIGVTLLAYLLADLAPGDPVTAMIDPITRAELGAEWVELRKEQLGLNDPAPVRYLLWLGEVAQGNLGYSLISGQSVAAQIGARLGPTLLLMGSALLVGTLVGIPLGVLSAVRQYSPLDYTTTVAGFLAISTPSFFLGLGLVYLFAVRWRLLPSSGMRTLGAEETAGDLLRHMILPVAVLAAAQAPLVMRYARSAMLEVLQQDYVTTARAKGARERVVLLGHAFRNALIPLITVLGLSLPELLSGAVITETIFQWPGMGLLFIQAVQFADIPIMAAYLMLVALIFVAINLAVDILYTIVDPRLRTSIRQPA